MKEAAITGPVSSGFAKGATYVGDCAVEFLDFSIIQ